MAPLRFRNIDLRVLDEVSVEFRWLGPLDDLNPTTLSLWVQLEGDDADVQASVLAVEHMPGEELRTYRIGPGGTEQIPSGRVTLWSPECLVAEFPLDALGTDGRPFSVWGRLSVGEEVVSRWGNDPDALVTGSVELDEDVLAGAERLTNRDLVEIAVRLGASQGELGIPALREYLKASGPGSQNLRGMSLVALAARCGADAGPDFLNALIKGPKDLREYAADAIFYVADASIWDGVLRWYRSWLQKPLSLRAPIPPAMPISYLIVHASQNREHAVELVGFLRTRWNRLLPFEQRWIHQFAPEIAPTGPPTEQVTLPRRAQLPFGPSDLFPVYTFGQIP